MSPKEDCVDSCCSEEETLLSDLLQVRDKLDNLLLSSQRMRADLKRIHEDFEASSQNILQTTEKCCHIKQEFRDTFLLDSLLRLLSMDDHNELLMLETSPLIQIVQPKTRRKYPGEQTNLIV